MKIFGVLLACLIQPSFISCDRQAHYKLSFNDSLPKEIANRFGNRAYNEGENVISNASGETLMVNIVVGKLLKIGYRRKNEAHISSDSLQVMLQNSGGNRGQDRQSYCNEQENRCLDGCPWVVLERDIFGRPTHVAIEPTCLERCQNVYDNCMSLPRSGLSGSIGVIRL